MNCTAGSGCCCGTSDGGRRERQVWEESAKEAAGVPGPHAGHLRRTCPRGHAARRRKNSRAAGDSETAPQAAEFVRRGAPASPAAPPSAARLSPCHAETRATAPCGAGGRCRHAAGDAACAGSQQAPAATGRGSLGQAAAAAANAAQACGHSTSTPWAPTVWLRDAASCASKLRCSRRWA